MIEQTTVPPALTQSDSDYVATPNERYAHAKSQAAGMLGGNADAESSPDTCEVSLMELVYPGGGGNLEEVQEKWIYVLRGRPAGDPEGAVPFACAAEVFAVASGQWFVLEEPNPHDPVAVRNPSLEYAGFCPLPQRDEGGRPWRYLFFLSPFQLGPESFARLLLEVSLDQVDLVTETLSDASGEWASARVAAHDPFRWASDAALKYYHPELDKWQAFVQDPEGQARLFIASAVKSWIEAVQSGSSDPLGIANEVNTGEPDKTIDGYKEGEAALREPAERAAAYVAHCVDSRDHWLVEQAAMEGGGQPLSDAFQHWAAVSSGMMLTEPGRRFLQTVCLYPDRLPGAYLFTEQSPQNSLSFAEYRYAWIAAVALFGEMVPAAIGAYNSWRWRNMSTEQKVLHWLHYMTDSVGVQFTVDVLTVKRDLSRGIPIADARKGAKATYRRLQSTVEDWPPKQVSEIADSLDAKNKHLADFLDNLNAPLGGLFEILNLCFAINGLAQANARERGIATVGVIGALGDSSSWLMGACGKLVQSGWRTRVAVAGGAAAMIGGICECVIQIRNMEQAIHRNDYGAAVGYGIAAAGGFVSAVGGVLAMGTAAATGSLATGPGAPIMAIGAVLVLGGVLIATMLTPNEYERFTRLCFLGTNHGSESVKFGWASEPIGKSTALVEAQVLTELISGFRIWGANGTRSNIPARLCIEPGHIPSGSRFEVHLVNQWSQAGVLHSLTYVDPELEECVAAPNKRSVVSPGWTRFKRNRHDRLAAIYLKAEHDEPDYKGVIQSRRAWVRLIVGEAGEDGKITGEHWTVPPRPGWTDCPIEDYWIKFDPEIVSSLERQNPLPAGLAQDRGPG